MIFQKLDVKAWQVMLSQGSFMVPYLFLGKVKYYNIISLGRKIVLQNF